MPFRLLLAEDAEREIEDIYRYVARHESIEAADRLVAAIEETCHSLCEFPDRGNIPKELQALGVDDYREVHYKPYRLIYRTFGRRVIVYGVFDGRRDMQSLLQRRLLR